MKATTTEAPTSIPRPEKCKPAEGFKNLAEPLTNIRQYLKHLTQTTTTPPPSTTRRFSIHLPSHKYFSETRIHRKLNPSKGVQVQTITVRRRKLSKLEKQQLRKLQQVTAKPIQVAVNAIQFPRNNHSGPVLLNGELYSNYSVALKDLKMGSSSSKNTAPTSHSSGRTSWNFIFHRPESGSRPS